MGDNGVTNRRRVLFVSHETTLSGAPIQLVHLTGWLQERGWTLGFAPSAVVWHHRRNSIKRYLKQQFGYAKAEALLWRTRRDHDQGDVQGRLVVEPQSHREIVAHQPVREVPGRRVCLRALPDTAHATSDDEGQSRGSYVG